METKTYYFAKVKIVIDSDKIIYEEVRGSNYNKNIVINHASKQAQSKFTTSLIEVQEDIDIKYYDLEEYKKLFGQPNWNDI